MRATCSSACRSPIRRTLRRSGVCSSFVSEVRLKPDATYRRLKPDATYRGNRRSASLLRAFRFAQPRPAKNVAERVVAFVARVLEEPLAGDRPRLLAGPRPHPRVRILDRETVAQRLCIDPREALDDVQVLARAAEACLVGEVRGVDDERIALPP